MELFFSFLKEFIWQYILIALLLLSGLYFTFRLRFIQVSRFPYALRLLLGSRETRTGKISSFQAFCIGLASRVGTGNLAGVAIALSLGGPGAIFWMWATALIGMATSFVECSLAQIFKVQNEDGTFRGGPAYYIKQGLGNQWLGSLFSVLFIFTVGLAFSAVQANSIADALHVAFGWPPLAVGVVVTASAGTIMFGGMRTLARVAEMVVPPMALLYLCAAGYVLVSHATEIPGMLALIVRSAFGLQEAGAGASGYLVSQALSMGIRRGLFSNEAGMGTSPNAAATSSPTPNHPMTQGFISMLGVFIDTLLICSSTAALILLSGAFDGTRSEITGIALTQKAATIEFGAFGAPFIAVMILLFAFTTILGNYAYSEGNLRYLVNHRKAIIAYRFLVMGVLIWGSVSGLAIVWTMADLFMGLMAMINIFAILKLAPRLFSLYPELGRQLREGKEPTFWTKESHS